MRFDRLSTVAYRPLPIDRYGPSKPPLVAVPIDRCLSTATVPQNRLWLRSLSTVAYRPTDRPRSLKTLRKNPATVACNGYRQKTAKPLIYFWHKKSFLISSLFFAARKKSFVNKFINPNPLKSLRKKANDYQVLHNACQGQTRFDRSDSKYASGFKPGQIFGSSTMRRFILDLIYQWAVKHLESQQKRKTPSYLNLVNLRGSKK